MSVSSYHAVFEPAAARSTGPASPPGLRAAVRGLRRFYARPISWFALGVTSVALCYVGGAAMFWFHAVALGEGGPAIAWYTHWLVDSTVGFIALTPPLFFLLPFGAWAADRLAGAQGRGRTYFYVLIVGGLFALLTVPGPLAHDLLVARGTWLANRITELFGDPSVPLAPTHEYPLASMLTSQFGFGIPVYVVMTAVALVIVRLVTNRRRRALEIEALAVALGKRARTVMDDPT